MVYRDRLFRNEIANATQKEHPCQGNDERGDLQRVNQKPHKCAEGTAHHQHQWKRQQRREAEIANHFCQKHTSKGDHRTDGEIDPTGEDHKSHADGDDPKKGVIGQDIADHSCGSKTGELRQAVEIAQHKDADGDHKRQVTFYHVYALL